MVHPIQLVVFMTSMKQFLLWQPITFFLCHSAGPAMRPSQRLVGDFPSERLCNTLFAAIFNVVMFILHKILHLFICIYYDDQERWVGYRSPESIAGWFRLFARCCPPLGWFHRQNILAFSSSCTCRGLQVQPLIVCSGGSTSRGLPCLLKLFEWS